VPDPGSAGLAEPIHGRLQVTYQVRPRTMPDGKRVLTIEVPAQDDKIIYTDLGGLSTGDVAALSGRIRAAVRKQFKPEVIELPEDFEYFEFKEVGGGQAVALPMQLSGAPGPPGALPSVTKLLLDPNTADVAIAVSREYVTAQFAPTLDRLRQYTSSFEVELPWYVPWPNPTYHLSVTGADLKFNAGWIDLVIQAK